MNDERKTGYTPSITYESPSEGATYESLKADGWDGEYSFYRGRDHQMVQKQIEDWKKEGYQVTVVASEDKAERQAGVAYIMRKKK